GKFTSEQREAMDLLARAYQAARAVVRPGVAIVEAEKAYYGVWREARPDSALARSAAAAELKELDSGHPHLIHAVGLGPVDRAGREFAAGAAFALEAQVSIPDHQTGLIIEDMFVVTESGTELI